MNEYYNALIGGGFLIIGALLGFLLSRHQDTVSFQRERREIRRTRLEQTNHRALTWLFRIHQLRIARESATLQNEMAEDNPVEALLILEADPDVFAQYRRARELLNQSEFKEDEFNTAMKGLTEVMLAQRGRVESTSIVDRT